MTDVQSWPRGTCGTTSQGYLVVRLTDGALVYRGTTGQGWSEGELETLGLEGNPDPNIECKITFITKPTGVQV